MNSSCTQHQRRKKKTKKSIQRRNTTSPIRNDIRKFENILSPNDELECRQIYEKLERLQPNGVCVDLNTLRRALYPPISLSKNINDQILSLKTYHQRTVELPQIRTNNIPKQTKMNKINLDQIINQVKKHAEINYSYYTRTK